MVTIHQQVTDATMPDESRASRPHGVVSTLIGVRRFQMVCVAAFAAAFVPYGWVLWDLWSGTVNPLRINGADNNPIYDVQARALLHGHFWLPPGHIGAEAFVVNGHEFTYFGIFPSLLRMPIFFVTSSLDGRLFAPSILASWVVTAVFCSLLLWRVRIFLRGNASLPWVEAVSYGVLLFSILAGSMLVFLASRPDVYNEDQAWSVALACASLFALVGVIEKPSSRRIILCGAFVLLTNLNRSTTGYAAIVAMFMLAGWFALGRAGQVRKSRAITLGAAALPALVIGCAIDYAKFHVLFGAPFSDQLVYQYFNEQSINGGHFLSLHWLPSTLQAYLDPTRIHLQSYFPYLAPGGGLVSAFTGDPTIAVELTMPLLCVLSLWGVVTAFWPKRSVRYRSLRILIVSAALTVAAVMIYGSIFERYTGDFLPLLIFAGMIGLIDVWRRTRLAPGYVRNGIPVAALLLALLGFWVNMSYAVSPQVNWSMAQARHYVSDERALGKVIGQPVVRTASPSGILTSAAPAGALVVWGNCKALSVDTAGLPKGAAVGLATVLIEQAPHTPICRALLGKR